MCKAVFEEIYNKNSFYKFLNYITELFMGKTWNCYDAFNFIK